MKITVVLLSVFTVVVLGFVLFFTLVLDHWVGLLAFQGRYVAFSLLLAGSIGAGWLVVSKRVALGVGAAALALLLAPFFLSEPSSRILRQVLNDVESGMPGELVIGMVEAAYEDSEYVMPRINHEADRIHVSLSSQHPGDCTALIFHLANGVVVKSEFSAD